MMASGVTAETRPWKRAAAWLAGLGILFFSSYNSANWLASQRAHVPAIVFSWESWVPYWPWTILPYWSIDLFYCVSLFMCATRRELDTHARRLLAVQVISVTLFIVAPLRYTFLRPETTGLFGAMLDALLLFDKPFNQAPALHISLLIILWVCYTRYLKGFWRWMLHGWFLLIGMSVLSTYQHHFFDIPTGVWLGWFCVWLFPHDAMPLAGHWHRTHDAQRIKLAAIYLAGALMLGTVAIVASGWWLWLLWAAGSLMLVALAYAGLGIAVFQKGADGTMSLASRWLLAPYLAGAWLNARWWTRHAAIATAVTPEIWLGRLPGREHALPAGITTLIDLCAELPCQVSSLAPRYESLPALDLIALTTPQLEVLAQAIDRNIVAGPVLVCCALGYSRSAAAVAGWLITRGRAASAREALAIIRLARPQVVLTEQQCVALDNLARATPMMR